MKRTTSTILVNAMVAGALALGASVASADDTAPAPETNAATVAAEAPAVVPGDILYFLKMIVERIELALTFNDAKEALLLADYAQERIAEANTLIAAGNEELAAETLKKASERQDQAMALAEVSELEPEADLSLDAAPADEEDSDVDASTEEDASSEKADLSVKLTNNVRALMQAMENVQNETAKAALLKNVSKSLARLEKKIGKLDPEAAAAVEANAASSEPAPLALSAAPTESVEAAAPVAAVAAVASGETDASEAPEDRKAAKAEAKRIKAEAKAEAKQEKAEAKQKKAEAKADAKQEKAQSK